MDQVARRTLAAFTLGIGLTSTLPAQDVASIAGRLVYKTTKAGVAGAEVTLGPRAARLVTDAAGHFRFDRVPPGTVSLLVRRLGFVPESASFEVRAADDLDLLIELVQAPQPLDTVTVAGREDVLARGRLAGFYERKRIGIGRFIEASELEQQQHRQLADIITTKAAGARMIRSLASGSGWIATRRRSGRLLRNEATVDDTDLKRGADPGACYSDVYLDGAVVYSFGRRAPLFDVNSMSVTEIAAIEFYAGPAQTPSQYNKTSSACGVLLIWTR
ncbi:MAG: carboxypeptidase-like regulatory domain-containing protein [Gemmatimonadaceae bacterium]